MIVNHYLDGRSGLEWGKKVLARQMRQGDTLPTLLQAEWLDMQRARLYFFS